MKFSPLKKILLASALTLAAAFNMTSCRGPRGVVDARLTSRTAGLPSDSIHREFDRRGELRLLARYRGGLLNDGPNGEPAWVEFNFDGNVAAVERYVDGKLNNGSRGEPAVSEFHDNGMIAHIEYYQSDFISDGPGGAPAFQTFNEQGKLILAIRYRKGEVAGVLSPDERAAYQASYHPERMKAPSVPKNFLRFKNKRQP